MYGKSKGRSGPKDPQIMPGLGPGLQQRFKEMSAQESLIAQKKKYAHHQCGILYLAAWTESCEMSSRHMLDEVLSSTTPKLHEVFTH